MTITALERIQQNGDSTSITQPSASKGSRDNPTADERLLERELNGTINGLEQQASAVMQNLSRSANDYVDHTIQILGNVKSESEAKNVILLLLDKLFGIFTI